MARTIHYGEDGTAYMRPRDLARLFGVTRRTISNWAVRGVLPHVRKNARVLLFDPRDVLRLFNERQAAHHK